MSTPDTVKLLKLLNSRLEVSTTSLQYEVVQKENVMQCLMWRNYFILNDDMLYDDMMMICFKDDKKYFKEV